MLTAAILAFSIGIGLQPFVIRQLTRRAVLDIPGERSNHLVPTPRGGGIALVVAALSGAIAAQEVPAVALMGCVLVAASVGALEDFRGVQILPRLLLTGSAALALLATLTLLGLPSGLVGVLLLVIAVPWTVAVINAVNFMDGINGISATVAVVAGVSYALLGHAADMRSLTALGVIFAAVGLAFAPYNVPRARVFLGDVGSYGLGAALAAMSLLAVSQGLPLEAAVAPLAVYLTDTGTTIVRRIRAGEPWHLPHKRHVYQQLVALGLSHVTVSVLIGSLIALCALLGAASLLGSTTARFVADAALAMVLAVYLASPRLVARWTSVA